ncbi:hypothetical protein I545_2670 [Mycobacterium kansasii 662]|uniref:Uncharacterized protein n=2 Tax=Mycobacterium kansasii TaxID=1768 RepID=A0A1V3WZ16_MYCKA|nr:hypothetical protein I547_4605 [Mycobacterium kansasii 824]EUA18549.1 hypothetical protein I545_2670 [Mycobacterium kansasii 662]KEP40656.1 hypothetical protein MKSMC1_42760 [Mycobacterium kansasii]OOK68448.1 hypothetical protein BZL29_6954 [Mycobacterium kansasii]OOK71786.1 hypothetical protein BZL30_5507 [Mycobacterium kansasii]
MEFRIKDHELEHNRHAQRADVVGLSAVFAVFVCVEEFFG